MFIHSFIDLLKVRLQYNRTIRKEIMSRTTRPQPRH